MADTIGRVEFIVGLDGSKLSQEAKDAGANIAKIGEEHGEKYGKGFDEESGEWIDNSLNRSMKRAEKKWLEGGKRHGKTYGEQIDEEVRKSFKKMEEDTIRAFSSKKGFEEFLKGFDDVDAAVAQLEANFKRLAEIEIITDEENDKAKSFFKNFESTAAINDMHAWAASVKESEAATKEFNEANEKARLEFDKFRMSIDAASFDKVAEDLGGSAEAADFFNQKLKDLNESGQVTEKQFYATTIAIEKQTESYDRNIQKTRDKVNADHELALSMERMRVETEKYDAAMLSLEGKIANQDVWNTYSKSLNDNEEATRRAKEEVHNLSVEFDIGGRETQKLNQKIDKLSLGFDKSSKSSKGFFGNLMKGFKQMPRGARTIALVTAAVLSLGSAMGAVASGGMAALVGMVSSLGVAAAGALAALGALAVGFIWTFAKAKDAIDMMAEAFPPAQAAMDRFTAAAEADSMAFAQAWGPALENFLNTLSQLWEDDHWGRAAGEALAGVTDAFTNALLSPAFTEFAKVMEDEIPNSILNVGTAAASLSEALMHTFAGVSPMLVEMTQGFADWAEEVAKSAEKAFDTGTMQEFFALALESINSVIGVIGSMGSLFKTVFREGADEGNEMLDVLSKMTDELNEFLNANTDGLDQWFDNGVLMFETLLQLIKDVSLQFAEMITQEAVDDAITALGGLSEALQFIFDLIQIMGGLDILGGLVIALQGVSAFLAPFTESLAALAEIVGDHLVTAFAMFVPILDSLGQILAPVVAAFAEMAGVIMTALMPVFEALMPVIQDIVAAFIPLGQLVGDVLVWAFNTLWPVVQTVIEFIAELIVTVTPLIDALLPLLKDLVDRAREAFERWKPIIELVASVIVGILIPAMDRMIAVIDRIIDIVVRVIAKFNEWGDWLGEKMPRLFGDFERSADTSMRNTERNTTGPIDRIVAKLDEMGQWLGEKMPRLFGDFENAAEESFSATDSSSNSMAGGVERSMGRIGNAVSSAIGWFDGLRTSAREAEKAANAAASAGGQSIVPPSIPSIPIVTPFGAPSAVPMSSDPSVSPFAVGGSGGNNGGNFTASSSESASGTGEAKVIPMKVVNVEAGAIVVQGSMAPETTALMVVNRLAERIAS